MNNQTKKILSITKNIFVAVFAIIGLFFVCVFFGMKFGLLNVRGLIADRNAFFTNSSATSDWVQSPEWTALSTAFVKDEPVITKVAEETGVSSRMIITVAMPEQLRFFTSNRDLYKKYFEPLKILGTMSQFSLGVTGIKPETANQIEKNLTDTTSDFYLGEKYQHVLDYPDGVVHDTELYNRLTDAHNHEYQYLYTALFIKQITAQWKKAGVDITAQPGIVATLFNLGFVKSKPNDHAVVGGAPITIGNQTLSFGQLGYEFYFSNQLRNQFPY